MMQLKPWMQIRKSGNDRLKVLLIVVLALAVSAFHFGTPTEHRYLHEIYQRIYYIPILLAAFWYGPLVGVVSAFLVSGIYLVHIQMDWHHTPVYTFNQYAEIILYHVIALIIGLLSYRQRQQQERLEDTSQRLSEAYAKLQSTFEQLRRADRLAALGELSAGIAHEIRNPLGSIKGSAEILEEEIPTGHPKREFLDIIKEESTRLNGIVNEVLRFARPPEPRIESTSLNELIEATLSLTQKEAANSGVSIQRHLDPQVPVMEIDPAQIRQVLLNVLLNAIQAMPGSGILEIRSQFDQSSRRVAVEISDSGPGVEDSQIEQIFDPFFSTKPGGTGLGLSISYQLIENHHGRLKASRSRLGGLSIMIELPACGDRREA
jgi:signal transduction histidine kinase